MAADASLFDGVDDIGRLEGCCQEDTDVAIPSLAWT
jgi:hypothetical protein